MEKLTVGFGRVDITAPDPIPMGGYGDPLQRLSEGVLLPLMATCVAITDPQEQTALLYTIDHLCTNQDWMEDLRSAIMAVTGVQADRIMLSATHTHSGPDVRDTVGRDHPYYAQFKNALVQAAVEAMADRSEAVLLTGSTVAENQNFVRHYVMSDGFMAGDNFGDVKNARAVRNHHKADNQVQLIRFAREGKKDILLVNFQAHPKLSSTRATRYGRENRLLQSSDVVGATRNYLEENASVLCACFQGAAGNLNPVEYYLESPPESYKRKNLEVYGKALGDAVLDAMPQMAESTQTPFLKTKQTHFQTPHKKTGSILTMELNALSLGEVAFVTAPYEMFDTSGVQIKSGSPFDTTFILAYANGRFGYVADLPTWEYVSADGRPAWELVLGYVEKGVCERLTDRLISMLKELQ